MQRTAVCPLLPAMLLAATGALFCQSAVVAQTTAPPRLNRFNELMEKEQPAFGMFAWNLSARSGAAAADSTLDFVIIDLEHSPYDVTRLETYLLGMTNKGDILKKESLQPNVVPLVRIPAAGREQLSFMIKQVLDTGAMGVIVPHVETAAEARAVVQACRFPQRKGVADFEPEGKRGAGYRWPARYWGISREDYAARADLWPLDPQGELTVWVMIESVKGLENAEAIARTPGVGGVFIGPGDLAFSLGVPPGDPAVETAMLRILAAAKKARVPCGTLTDAAHVEEKLAQGFRLLAVGFDSGIPESVEQAVKAGRAFPSKPSAGTQSK